MTRGETDRTTQDPSRHSGHPVRTARGLVAGRAEPDDTCGGPIEIPIPQAFAEACLPVFARMESAIAGLQALG